MVQRQDCSEEYTLYCPCSQPDTVSQWSLRELGRYAISAAAHARGYGSPKEIVFWISPAQRKSATAGAELQTANRIQNRPGI
jgi:hypothetical protein